MTRWLLAAEPGLQEHSSSGPRPDPALEEAGEALFPCWVRFEEPALRTESGQPRNWQRELISSVLQAISWLHSPTEEGALMETFIWLDAQTGFYVFVLRQSHAAQSGSQLTT